MFSFNKAPATTAASLNFNTTTTSMAAAQPLNANQRLGTNTLTATNTLGGGGIFGKPLTTTTQAAAAAPPAFVGLGGIDVSASQPKLGDNKQDGIKVSPAQDIHKDI